ncbi:hypothetical protein EC501_17970 [Lysinibacillus halotolerans]|uniref:Uncharacterized protein n=1 Tax=Lysinibacillus halotolerans TaxID=1368476 RepID=A0A3M8GYS5_9BACI|nr:hypothetical protein EC501_17970 [Lysinibacillus halotolerans]
MVFFISKKSAPNIQKPKAWSARLKTNKGTEKKLEKWEDRGKQGIKEARSAVYLVHEHRTDADDAVFRLVIVLRRKRRW